MKNNKMLDAALECRTAGGEFEIEIYYRGMTLSTTYFLEHIDIYDDYFVIWGHKYDLTIYPDEFQYYDGVWHSLGESIIFKY